MFKMSLFIYPIALAIAYGVSLILRQDVFYLMAGSESLEATYHVLWTILSLANNSIDSHYLLPTVTLFPDSNQLITWGATFPTPRGSFVYTSFGPLSFLLPYWIISLLNVDITFTSLAYFNSIIGLLSAILLGTFCSIFARQYGSEYSLKGIFLITSIIYIFLSESLISHGAVYWAHSVSQLVFIAAILVSYLYVQVRKEPFLFLILCLLCFVFPLLEWTGYVFNVGLVLAFMFLNKGSVCVDDFRPRNFFELLFKTKESLLIIATTFISGALFLGHYIYALGFIEVLEGLALRAFARGVTHSSSLEYLLLLPYQYFLSIGFLFVFAVIFSLPLMRNIRTQPASILFVLFISIFPLLENLIMLNHAYNFSFDRLKIAVPCLILLTLHALKRKSFLSTCFFFLIVSLILISNILLFNFREEQRAEWGEALESNLEISHNFSNSLYSECKIYGHNANTRGYLNLLFKHDIYERTTPEKLIEQEPSGKCFVFITTQNVFTDLPLIKKIDIYDNTGSRVDQLN